MHMKLDLGILAVAVTQESDHASFPMKNQGRRIYSNQQ